MLSYYNGSLIKALLDVFPDIKLDELKFSRPTSNMEEEITKLMRMRREIEMFHLSNPFIQEDTGAP